MKILLREDSVVISGYVNSVERLSKPLMSRMGRFIERIRKGAFFNALKRDCDVHILVDHDWSRDVGCQSQGNLELTEDNIGLHARATITDPQTIEDARNDNLVGWSFGFEDVPDGVDRSVDQESGLPLRNVKDMILREVSILTRAKVPAYDGTLIMARSDDEIQLIGEAFMDDIEVREEKPVEESTDVVVNGASEVTAATEEKADDEIRDEEKPQQEEHPEAIDYSPYEAMISEMKGEC